MFEVLDNLDPMNRNADGPLRIPILDRYRDAGCTVALGKIESGTVSVGDIITIMPNRVCFFVFFSVSLINNKERNNIETDKVIDDCVWKKKNSNKPRLCFWSWTTLRCRGQGQERT